MMGDRLPLDLPEGKVEFVIVLVGVSHPGNLGAICRTMLNYGYADLRLVNPKCSVDDDETRARAKHAQRILDEVKVYTSLGEAVTDCRAVVGTSGKREVGDKTLFRHYVYPWDMVDREEKAGGRVALVFGEEGKGLSREDLSACDYFVTLPTWEGYPIANLSHAVNALIYEAHRSRVLAGQGTDRGMPDIVPLSQVLQPNVRQALLEAIHQFATSMNGPEERLESIEHTLKRTLLKGTPSNEESTRLIGAFVEATSALEFSNNDPYWKKEHRRRLR
jgi:TrmH family RNA methyltransferase